MDDWEPIPLSQLSHAGFCLRRAALLTNEQVKAAYLGKKRVDRT